jgi:hypothetical protein
MQRCIRSRFAAVTKASKRPAAGAESSRTPKIGQSRLHVERLEEHLSPSPLFGFIGRRVRFPHAGAITEVPGAQSGPAPCSCLPRECRIHTRPRLWAEDSRQGGWSLRDPLVRPCW